MTEGWRERGGAAAACRCISSPPGPSLRAPRPIAKFNAKVMRARVRLRAALQERPAAGEPSVPHGRARNTPHRDFLPTRPTGLLGLVPQVRNHALICPKYDAIGSVAGRFRRVTEFHRCTMCDSNDALSAAPCINYATSLQMSQFNTIMLHGKEAFSLLLQVIPSPTARSHSNWTGTGFEKLKKPRP